MFESAALLTVAQSWLRSKPSSTISEKRPFTPPEKLPHAAFGSSSDLVPLACEVRFTPVNRHRQPIRSGPIVPFGLSSEVKVSIDGRLERSYSFRFSAGGDRPSRPPMPATLAHAFDTVRANVFGEVLSERRAPNEFRRAFQTQRFLRLTTPRERVGRSRRCDIVSEVGLLGKPLILGRNEELGQDRRLRKSRRPLSSN